MLYVINININVADVCIYVDNVTCLLLHPNIDIWPATSTHWLIDFNGMLITQGYFMPTG